MEKKDIERIFESRCRTAINYASYRYAFFFKINIILCVLSIASLWCAGCVASGDDKTASLVLNIAGSVLLISDVVLNLVGAVGYWKSIRCGYYDFFSEFTEIRSKASVEELESLMARFVKYDSRCEACYNALGLIAWNDACIQMGKDKYVKKIPWYKRLTANFFSWGSVADNFK